MRAVFGDPWSSKRHRQDAVIESAMEIIDATPAGETLLVSIFNMTYPGFDDTLIRAHRRGVHVKVLVNREKSGRKRYDALKRELGFDTGAESWFVVRGGKVRMHSKFVLATRSGDREDVVWMSSGNMTIASGRHQANEALEITGDAELHAFFAEQFALMARGVKDAAKLARSATTPTAVVQTYPLPEGGAANDPVYALLDDITCVVAGKPTVIRMAQLFFTDERLYLADKLRELKAAGCDVRLVGHMSQWDRAKSVLTEPGAGRIDVRSTQGAALHTKITTIQGWDAAGDPLEIAMAGSHNLSGRALTRIPEGVNDEFSIVVADPDTVRAYSDFVDLVIEKHSKPIS
ncbi:MAG: phospholipase D-like domain-containing protein [Propionicimonas sp.]|nr:phospholipase D-like domain-containing protein [Propionicimonas sp.]